MPHRSAAGAVKGACDIGFTCASMQNVPSELENTPSSCAILVFTVRTVSSSSEDSSPPRVVVGTVATCKVHFATCTSRNVLAFVTRLEVFGKHFHPRTVRMRLVDREKKGLNARCAWMWFIFGQLSNNPEPRARCENSSQIPNYRIVCIKRIYTWF